MEKGSKSNVGVFSGPSTAGPESTTLLFHKYLQTWQERSRSVIYVS